jgi:membrane associated rhomboid family serine protease
LLSGFILHQGIIHIAFNVVWQITTVLRIERFWGMFRVAFVYLLSGIGGLLLSSVFLPDTITIGANCCLCGLLSSLLAEVLMNWKIVYAPWKSLLQITIQLTLFFALGFIPGIGTLIY